MTSREPSWAARSAASIDRVRMQLAGAVVAKALEGVPALGGRVLGMGVVDVETGPIGETVLTKWVSTWGGIESSRENPRASLPGASSSKSQPVC